MSGNNKNIIIPEEYRPAVEGVLKAEPSSFAFESAEKFTSTKLSLKNIFSKYKKRTAAAIFVVIILTILQSIGPMIFAKAIDDGIIKKNVEILLFFSMIYLSIIVARTALGFVSTRLNGFLAADLQYNIRILVFKHIQKLSLDYYTKTKAGEIMSRLTSDINALSGLFQEILINIFVQLIALVTTIVIIFYMDSFLASVLIVTVIPPVIITSIWFRKSVSPKFKSLRKKKANVVSELRESIYGIKQIASFNLHSEKISKHKNTIREYCIANFESVNLGSLYPSIAGIIEIVAQCIILLVGYGLVVDGDVSLGELVAFSLFLNRFFGTLEQLTLLFRDMQEGFVAIAELKLLLKEKPSITNKKGAVEIKSIKGFISFHNVSFSYNTKNKVLSEITLDVAPGEIVALAGSTGAGKSSIVKLLNRMYDPDEGDIEIDGINIRDVTLSSLRRQIGVVPQSPHIFSGTIRDNLLFANPEASEDELQNAVTLSRLNKVIECFPDGLDTECGERGLQLSAGQKQLISIARLFLLRPAILILDEATSNIDRNLEYEIEIALKTLLEKRTAIIVSHRLYNLQSANRIYVLQEGKIVEKGDYESLERSGGWFSEALLKQKNQID